MPCWTLLHCPLGPFADPVSCFVGPPKASSSPEGRNPVPFVSPPKMVLQPPDDSVALCCTSTYFCPSCTDSPKPEWWVEQYNCFTWSKAYIPPFDATKPWYWLCCQGMDLNHLQLAVPQDPQVFFSRPSSQPVILKPVLLQDIFYLQCRNFHFARVEFCWTKKPLKTSSKNQSRKPHLNTHLEEFP